MKFLLISLGICAFLAFTLSIFSWRFEESYRADVSENLNRSKRLIPGLLTESDLAALPDLVQNYIRESGTLWKVQTKNMMIEFEGKMRARGKDFFPFSSEKYNFIEDPSRLFFMNAKFSALTVQGYHRYMSEKASMNIRIFGIIPVASFRGPEMNQAETVTLFNDMCLFAPGSLIDKRISWSEGPNPLSVLAKFKNGSQMISAILQFDESGRLRNFISNDRIEINENRKLRFSTPIIEYTEKHGYLLPYKAQTIWHYPEGEFIYGEFTLKDIKYNL